MTQPAQRNGIAVIWKLLVRWTLSMRKVVQPATPLLPGGRKILQNNSKGAAKNMVQIF